MDLFEATRNYQMELERTRRIDDEGMWTELDDDQLALISVDLGRARAAMQLAFLEAKTK